MKKLISILVPCYNEADNVEELYRRLVNVMMPLPYNYEIIFIDNASTDQTVNKLKLLASFDPGLKIIVNVRNFGQVRSPYYGILQSKGDACISLAADLEDPPELILDFIKKWEEGYKTVLAVKSGGEESGLWFYLRRLYYSFLGAISEVQLVRNATGFGLIDKDVVNILRALKDPYPYYRGLLCEIGFPIATINFYKPSRQRGLSKNNFYTLFDMAMLGVTSHTKLPLRLMSMLGFTVASLSLLIAIFYLIVKLLFWDSFDLGTAPLLIGIFFFGALQIFFVGFLGEYIGAIHTQVRCRDLPLVVEKERINF